MPLDKESIMFWINIVILSAPLFTLPIFLLPETKNWQLKIGLFFSVTTILGLAFGLYGRITSGLLIYQIFPDFDLANHHMLSDRIKALGVFASWGTTYPLSVITKKTLPQLRVRSYISNTIFVFTYFYGLHFIFSGLGIFILWVYL